MEMCALLGVQIGELVADRVSPRGGAFLKTGRFYMRRDLLKTSLRQLAPNPDSKSRVGVFPIRKGRRRQKIQSTQALKVAADFLYLVFCRRQACYVLGRRRGLRETGSNLTPDGRGQAALGVQGDHGPARGVERGVCGHVAGAVGVDGVRAEVLPDGPAVTGV